MTWVYDILKWIGIIFAILVGIFVLSLYIRGAFRWRPVVDIKGAIAPTDDRLPLSICSVTGGYPGRGRVIKFWHNIDDIQQARITAIKSAHKSIQFETFMMTPGQRADDFAEAIDQKAREGVKVQLLVDTLGARALPQKYWNRLRSAGAQIVHYNPFDWRAPANFAGRTHRKLLIIDGELALIGGAGISDLWDGTVKSDDRQPWFDIELALRGEAVGILSAQFQTHWQGHRVDRRQQIHATALNLDVVEKAQTKDVNTENIAVIPSTRPSYRDSPIEWLKHLMIASARKRIWLASPYFLPNKSTRQLLIAAQRSGVEVKILTTSERTDKKPVYYASQEVYGDLLRANIDIFEFQPSMLHAKLLLIDDHWVNTGSANLDYRSLLHNDELDILSDSPRLVKEVKAVFEEGFAQSQQMNLHQWRRRNVLKHRVLGNIVRLVQWQL